MAKKVGKLDVVPTYPGARSIHEFDKAPREKVVKLGKKITDVLAHKLRGVHVEDPEYWGLAEILTDEMCDIGLAMKIRHPYSFEEMKKLCPNQAKDPEHFKKVLDEMAYIGLLELEWGYHFDHNGRTAPMDSDVKYILSIFVPGSAEMFNMDETPDCRNPRLEEHKAVANFFERMTYIPLAGITQMVPEGGSGVGMHVIPVEEAISMNNEALDIEKLSYWLKKYDGEIGVGQCSCRASRKLLGTEDEPQGCADDQWGWCIGLGDFARYCRETGKGHPITADEAIAILKKGEEQGFVHQITNIDGENKIFGICNCNVNICNALRTSQLFNTPNLSRSAYTAKVTPENCVACGRCVEYCPAGAVKLGQKLCTKQGPIVYPRHELPDWNKWGTDKWDPDYRDNNRINCYDTGTAPCKTACPAHIAIQGYLKMAAQGRYEDALALIKKENPFPAVCGRICNKRCEAACTRGTVDEAVAIDAVKKFIAERDLHAKTRYVPKVEMAVSPARQIKLDHWEQKIAIIGAGPAGLSCAYYLAIKGYKPVVFEKNEKPGGMMVYGIPSYKLEKDVIEAEIDIIRELGVEIKCGVEVGKDITLDELRKEGFKAFYLAIGCQGGNLPGILGEDAAGVEVAVDFLHKATDDNTTKWTGDVVVVGGGNVAVDCARTAKRFTDGKVTMLSLETRETMPASLDEIEETLEDGIEINNAWGPKEIKKDENGNVKSIIFKKCLRTIDPETKMFSPLYDENNTIELPASHVIFAIGQKVVYGDLLKGTKVEFGRGNRPIADPLTYQTKEKDIFVGGDVYTGPKFVIDAIAQGKNASESLHRFVHEGASLTIGRNRRQFIELDKENIVLGEYDTAKRQNASPLEGAKKLTFKDYSGTLTEEQVKIETARCLGCGASIVDPNKCIGCGICTTKCEFDAIHLVRDHPNASTMRRSEDKFKYILPYSAKRAVKILFKKKPESQKQYEKEYKEYKKKVEAAKKEAK